MKSLTKKLFLSIIGSSASLMVHAGEEWLDSPDGFDYSSKILSCKIDNKGNVLNLRTPKTEVLSSSLIHAATSDATNKKNDLRIFQTRKCESIKVRQHGEDTYSLALRGTLGNKGSKHVADYLEKISLTPAKITFDYEVTVREPLKMNYYQPFTSLQCAPCSSLKGLGYVTVDRKGKEKFCVFPAIYDKEDGLHKSSIRSMRIVLPVGHIVFQTDENSSMLLRDTRSWGGKYFRFDVVPLFQPRPKPLPHPVGTKFKWSYSITFEDK